VRIMPEKISCCSLHEGGKRGESETCSKRGFDRGSNREKKEPYAMKEGFVT